MNPEEFMLQDPEAAVIIDAYNKSIAESISVAVDPDTVTGSVTIEKPMSIIPEMMPGMEKIIKDSAAEEFDVDPEDSRYYISKDKKKKVRRATSLLNKQFDESERLTAYQNRGNALDEILRLFFEPESKNGAITKLAFRDVVLNMFEGKKTGKYKEAAIKKTIEKWVKENLSEQKMFDKFGLKPTDGFYLGVVNALYTIGYALEPYKIVSSMPTMFGMISTGEIAAGTIDLLGEKKDGTLHIIDIKTFAIDRLGDETKLSDAVQQNVYREIIEGNSDRTVSTMKTIQIQINLQSDNQTVTSAEIRKDANGRILNDVSKSDVSDLISKPEQNAKETNEQKEAEKQKITPSEFKEVVRLAKFFLENPSEPGVKGDARSRYPELFKVVTDIEERRQASIKGINKTSKEIAYTGVYYPFGFYKDPLGTFSNLNPLDKGKTKIAPDEEYIRSSIEVVTDKINAKYDAELADLEGKPAEQAAEEKTEGDTEEKDTKLFLRARFKGKLVYMTPGAGKTTAVKKAKKAGLPITDMDDLLVEAVKALAINVKSLGVDEVTNSNIGAVIYEMYQKGMSKEADAVYAAAMAKTKDLLKAGYTVLTGSQRFIKNADVVVISEDKAKLAAQLLVKSGKTDMMGKINASEESVFERSPEKVEVLSNMTASELLLSGVEKEEQKAFSETPEVKRMREAKSKMELDATLQSYVLNKNRYTYIDADGSRKGYTPVQIGEIAAAKAVELDLGESFLNHIDDILGLKKGPISKSDESDLKDNLEAARDETITSAKLDEIAQSVSNGSSDITDEDIEGLNICETPEL